MDLFKWLEEWYYSMCDGGWEHCYGVTICTVDNPGWSVFIDIEDTPLEGKKFEDITNYISDNDWIFCKIKDGKFNGGGDPTKLIEILKIFKAWVEK